MLPRIEAVTGRPIGKLPGERKMDEKFDRIVIFSFFDDRTLQQHVRAERKIQRLTPERKFRNPEIFLPGYLNCGALKYLARTDLRWIFLQPRNLPPRFFSFDSIWHIWNLPAGFLLWFNLICGQLWIKYLSGIPGVFLKCWYFAPRAWHRQRLHTFASETKVSPFFGYLYSLFWIS